MRCAEVVYATRYGYTVQRNWTTNRLKAVMIAQTLNAYADDEAAVRALYQQLMDAWNEGSGEAFAAVFAEGGDLIGFDGTHLVTWRTGEEI